MKKILLITLFSLFSLVTNKAYSQNYSAGTCYQTQTFIQNRCNGCYCQKAVWHSAYGTQWVYVWNGYGWTYVQRTGYYYWYTWRNYNRCQYRY